MDSQTEPGSSTSSLDGAWIDMPGNPSAAATSTGLDSAGISDPPNDNFCSDGVDGVQYDPFSLSDFRNVFPNDGYPFMFTSGPSSAAAPSPVSSSHTDAFSSPSPDPQSPHSDITPVRASFSPTLSRVEGTSDSQIQFGLLNDFSFGFAYPMPMPSSYPHSAPDSWTPFTLFAVHAHPLSQSSLGTATAGARGPAPGAEEATDAPASSSAVPAQPSPPSQPDTTQSAPAKKRPPVTNPSRDDDNKVISRKGRAPKRPRPQQDTTPRFPCKECDRIFARKSNLSDHVKAKHRRERRFICEVSHCARAFGKKHDLRRHFQSEHTDRPSPRRVPLIDEKTMKDMVTTTQS